MNFCHFEKYYDLIVIAIGKEDNGNDRYDNGKREDDDLNL